VRGLKAGKRRNDGANEFRLLLEYSFLKVNCVRDLGEGEEHPFLEN